MSRNCNILIPRFLFVITFFTNVCAAQSYEENIDKCTKAYQGSLAQGKKDKDQGYMKAMQDLRECIIGQTFPPFAATSLEGKTYTAEDLKGKVVLINLWFIACAPCVAEMPILNELNTEFKERGFILLAFATDDKTSLKNFLRKRNIGYEVFEQSKALIHDRFKMTFGYPTNIFLNKEGKIVEFRNGGPMDEEGLKRTKEEFRSIIEKELVK